MQPFFLNIANVHNKECSLIDWTRIGNREALLLFAYMTFLSIEFIYYVVFPTSYI